MRELIRHHIVVVVRAYIGGVITKFMGVLVVVGNGKHIAFFAQTMPVEVNVGISKHIGLIRHPLTVCHICHCASHRCLHIVADIHLSEISSQTYPL